MPEAPPEEPVLNWPVDPEVGPLFWSAPKKSTTVLLLYQVVMVSVKVAVVAVWVTALPMGVL
jgi:hypothetical protein